VNASFLQVMRVGEAVANMSDVPSPQRNAHLQPLLQRFLNCSATDIRTCLADAIATASEMGRLFQIPVPEGERWNDLMDRIREELMRPNGVAPALATVD
jgi:hypothetical protein